MLSGRFYRYLEAIDALLLFTDGILNHARKWHEVLTLSARSRTLPANNSADSQKTKRLISIAR
jgi:hypothetical protein